VGQLPSPSTILLLLGLAIRSFISCCGDAVAIFKNGGEVVRFQVIVASIFGIACVFTNVYCVHHFGIFGVPGATIITYLLLNALPVSLHIPPFIKSV